MRAIAPAMVCMVTPITHPAMIMDVQAICGLWRTTMTPTEAKAEPVARKVRTGVHLRNIRIKISGYQINVIIFFIFETCKLIFESVKKKRLLIEK